MLGSRVRCSFTVSRLNVLRQESINYLITDAISGPEKCQEYSFSQEKTFLSFFFLHIFSASASASVAIFVAERKIKLCKAEKMFLASCVSAAWRHERSPNAKCPSEKTPIEEKS